MQRRRSQTPLASTGRAHTAMDNAAWPQVHAAAVDANAEQQLAALRTLNASGILTTEDGAYARHQSAVLADWGSSRAAGTRASTQQMVEQRLRLRAETGKTGLRDKLVRVGEQQRTLRSLCEQTASEQAAVRSAELEAKAAVASHCAALSRQLTAREHLALASVAGAEATEREQLGRQCRAADARREALADAVGCGSAALSMPDGVDFIAASLSAIALLDAELAVPPGEAHHAVEAHDHFAPPPIQDLLDGTAPPVSPRAAVQKRLACDASQLAASAARAVVEIGAMALPAAPHQAVTQQSAGPPPPPGSMPRQLDETGAFDFDGLTGQPLSPVRIAAQSQPQPPPQSALAGELQDGLHVMRRKAASGDPTAMYRLGCCLQHGLGAAIDLNSANECFRAAAEQEHAAAQFALGYALQGEDGRVDEKVRWFRKAAGHGHAEAQCALGCCVLSGEATVNSGEVTTTTALEAEAVALFAAAAGATPPLVEAQCNLAACLVIGRGGSRDLAKARELYLAAAESGDPTAQCALGDLLAGHAQGVEGDEGAPVVELEEACRWWAEAASGGVGLAALRLGGVSEDRGDYMVAIEWYETAVDATPPVEGLAEALMSARTKVS